MPARQHLERLRERDSCGERGCGSSEVESHAGDAGAGDSEGEEGESRALGRGGQEPEEDRGSTELIGGEIAFEGALGRVGIGRGAGTGCEGCCLASRTPRRSTS